MVPDGTNWEGWAIGDSTIANAMVTSAITLEGLTGKMPSVEVWLSPHAARLGRYTPGTCRLVLGADVQALMGAGPELAQQLIAAMITQCYIFENLTTGSHLEVKWWEIGLSLYLSDVIYPNASLELQWGIPAKLAQTEAATTLTQRGSANQPFFEYLDSRLGLQGTVDAVMQISFSGVESLPQIDELWHDCVTLLSQGVILDQGVIGFHTFAPAAAEFTLTETGTFVVAPRALGQERLHLKVEAAKTACIGVRGRGQPGHAGVLAARQERELR